MPAVHEALTQDAIPVAPKADENIPATQGVHIEYPDAEEYDPAAHFMQKDAPDAEYVPASHEVQDDAAAAENVPLPHEVQDDAVAAENVPFLHSVQ